MAAFQVYFIAFAFDVIDRHDPSDKMHRQLIAIYIAAKDVLPALHY